MANVVFYIRTKFIKIEKKKVVNIVKNRKFKYRNFFLYGNFKNYCKENKPFAKFYFTKIFPKWSFVNVYLAKYFPKWPFAKVYLAKLQEFRLKPRESLSRESFSD